MHVGDRLTRYIADVCANVESADRRVTVAETISQRREKLPCIVQLNHCELKQSLYVPLWDDQRVTLSNWVGIRKCDHGPKALSRNVFFPIALQNAQVAWYGGDTCLGSRAKIVSFACVEVSRKPPQHVHQG